jgi:hypothetical protein
MKGAVTLGIYVAIGIIPACAGTAAFGQSSVDPMNVPPPSPISPSSLMHPPAPIPPGWKQVVPDQPPETVVIKYGQGGRVDEHQQRFSYYQRAKTRVELRGPCYSACTMLLTYVEPENLCIAEGAFMAFHAVRSLEKREYMEHQTWQYYLNLPRPIRQWINAHGSWQALPLDGYWTMYDRELWAMGYPKCK